MITSTFGLDADNVRVSAPYVGGGFGSKGVPHAHVVLAVMAAKALPGVSVKLALTRQHMFSLVGYRTPTVQWVQLAADASGHLSGLAMDVVEQTSRIKEFAEQTAVASRTLYAAANRRTTHRLAALDVPVPSWMRAPGEAPGMFGPEVALDELAEACGLDPVEIRSAMTSMSSRSRGNRSPAGTSSSACARVPAGSVGRIETIGLVGARLTGG